MSALAIDAPYLERIHAALEDAGEVLVIVRYAGMDGMRDWLLVTDHTGLDRAISRVRQEGGWGRSDRVEVYATGELPLRGAESTPAAALQLLAEHGEIVLAVRDVNDAERLHTYSADNAADVSYWFREFGAGETLLGPHVDRHPDGAPGVFAAYGGNVRGEVVPGAY